MVLTPQSRQECRGVLQSYHWIQDVMGSIISLVDWTLAFSQVA